ncbi:MAG TPA: FtsH protease activity modulator HflK, partial [Synergistales bacterium]|nr:FtsH protease activity modulator HflK [Synergistales bacterium]
RKHRFDKERMKHLLSGKLGFLKYILILLVILLVAKQGFYIIPAGYRGVVFRLGKISSVSDQGVNFKIPLIDRVTIVNTEKIQRFEYGYRTISVGPPARYQDRLEESKMLTGDNKIVEIDWVLQFQIANPADFVVNVPSDENMMIKMIRDVAEATLRQVIASRKLDDVLTTEKEASQTESKQLIQDKMNELQTGIVIVAVQFQDVVPPKAVQAAFSEINSARAEKERLILEADKYSNEIISKARGEVEKVLNEAEAYRFRRISLAEGEAARITSLNQAYKENPDLVLHTLWFENMKDVWPGLKVVLIDDDKDSLQILPLEELLEMTSEASGQNQGGK